MQFPNGLTKIISYIVANVLPKYKDQVDLAPKITAIVKFRDDLLNIDNIKAIRENAVTTLNIIKNDLILYITEHNKTMTGGEETKVLPVTPYSSTSVTTDLKPIADVKPILDLKPIADVKPILDLKPIADVKPIPDLKNKLDTIFIDYFNERINEFEDIKLNNIIKNNNIMRPDLLPYLVTELLKQISNPYVSLSDIKLTIYSIISWYLSHNKVRGIDLPSYTKMLSEVSSDSDLHKYFIYEINSYLIPGSVGWIKAVS